MIARWPMGAIETEGVMIMAKKANAAELNWQEIDPATLPAIQAAAYQEYKVAQRAAAELRTKFTASMNEAAELPEGFKMVFSFNFGMLKAAIVADDAKPKAASKSASSLADFIKAQAAAGRRA